MDQEISQQNSISTELTPKTSHIYIKSANTSENNKIQHTTKCPTKAIQSCFVDRLRNTKYSVSLSFLQCGVPISLSYINSADHLRDKSIRLAFLQCSSQYSSAGTREGLLAGVNMGWVCTIHATARDHK